MASKEEKFLTAIDENKGIIYKVANAYARNKEDNKDLVQEIIFQLWRSFEAFGQRSSLSTWIYRVAFNVSVSHRRNDMRRQWINTPISESAFVNIEQEPNAVDEKIELLQKCIKELNSLDKAQLKLKMESEND